MLDVFNTQTWAYIHGQIDFKKKYRIHIYKEDKRALCGVEWTGDDIGEMTIEQYNANMWHCKRCLKVLEKNQGL